MFRISPASILALLGKDVAFDAAKPVTLEPNRAPRSYGPGVAQAKRAAKKARNRAAQRRYR